MSRGYCRKCANVGRAAGQFKARAPMNSKYPLSLFGRNVLARRDALGMTAQELARRAGIAINTLTTTTRRTPRSPTLYVMEWIAQALGTTVRELLNEADDTLDA